MTDLVSYVPPHEPADDTLAFAGKAALSAIPVVGPIAAETLAHALDTRQAERQHDFNLKVAYALTEALERLDASLTVEGVVDSDEFVAAISRAQRAAAETASLTKRRRLASAVVNGGSWAPFSTSEREQFTRLVEDFDELHVFLLHYFVDPKAWLDSHGLKDEYERLYMATAGSPLSAVLGVPEEQWRASVDQAVSDLARNGLADIPLRTMMSADGVIASRTNQKGRDFLSFLNERSSASADAPSL
ncbi:hypothetical protein [Microbacterium sp.]|jgi:hypothetical protein|uniref:hypothetical protein n=1 Tax=Microbacterium sp. TaxID=51671 RepID=UPI0025FA6D20|nr:hypothetical protein [Microbacterium sp.]MBT9608142.1 hypothetical protein [Microbacterium sp.]